jgi:hypothetical protein
MRIECSPLRRGETQDWATLKGQISVGAANKALVQLKGPKGNGEIFPASRPKETKNGEETVSKQNHRTRILALTR